MPFGVDQPDNAARVARLGVARVLGRRQYRAGRVVAELERMLGTPAMANRAAEVGEAVRAEDGVGRACDALEAKLCPL